MLARSDALSDCEQIIELLSRYASNLCAAPVLRDIREVQRLLNYYSFRTPQLADRFADQLSARYRYEMFGLYPSSGSPRRQPDSSYLRLQQLLGALVRVAAARLCCEGELSLTPAQISASDGLLLLALQNATGHG